MNIEVDEEKKIVKKIDGTKIKKREKEEKKDVKEEMKN